MNKTHKTPPPADSPAVAERLLCDRISIIATETLDLADAAGRVLAQPLLADRPSPAIDVSVMDGFAVRLADVSSAPIRVMGDSVIGHAPAIFPATGCLRIVTGAPLPPGADCVVRREDVSEADGAVRILPDAIPNIKPGINVRRRGENALDGALVVESGSVVTPAVAGALASCGAVSVLVFRRVRIGVLTTGDEVLPPSQFPEPWQLRDSNGAALAALCSTNPMVEAVQSGHAPDDPAQLRAAAAALLESCDALFLTGGVSMGHRDFVPSVLADLGVQPLFHKVPQRPGRPLLGAVSRRGQPVLALPGNPVSVLATARRIGVPVLQHLAGAKPQPRPRVQLCNPDHKALDLWWHRLVRLTAAGCAELVDNRGSGDIFGASRSDGFVEVPPGAAAGEGVAGALEFFAWNW